MSDDLRSALSRKIAFFIGSSDKLVTVVPGLSFTRRTGPSAPMCGTYEPSLAVIAQGRKRVELGRTSFIFDESPELRSACCRLVDLLETPQDIPFLSGLIQREIIYRILRGPEGARLRAIATKGDQSHRTAKAIAWLRTNYSKPLRIEELAQMVGMGVSTLHHHFRALTAMSPLQYQKQLRLQAARGHMLTDGFDAASAAFAVGYESASQFNREYSRFFGQPPMRDIRTLTSFSYSWPAEGEAAARPREAPRLRTSPTSP